MKTDVYQYLKIDKTNIENTGIGSVIIKFQVPKSWLIEKKIGTNEISLFKYTNNKWNELNTKVFGSDHAYVFYEAKTTGFSYFAIGVKEKKEEKVEKEEEIEPEEIVSEEEKEEVRPEEKKAPEVTGAVVTVKEEGVTPLIITWITIGIVIIATIMIVIEIMKRQHPPKIKDLEKASKDIDKKIEQIDQELSKIKKK